MIAAPLHTPASTDCVRFEQESFGAIHQMLSTLDETAKQDAWREIADELAKFQRPNGFEGPCEMVVAVGVS